MHGSRPVYSSDWVGLDLVDVEIPDGARFEHHVVRSPRPAVGTVVVGPAGVLLLYRHRFITGTWGWEVPAGGVDVDESLPAAAAREVLEETGWRPGPLRRLHGYHPSNGLSDQRFELFLASGASYVGEPSDPGESSRVEWVPAAEVRRLVAAGEVQDGLSVTALLWWLAFEA
ncbi:MAG: hydrolase [Frankiales bacterium]|nr:hydrolase [Frankiales bacterium]